LSTEIEQKLLTMSEEDVKANLDIELEKALIKLKSTNEYKLVIESYLFETLAYEIFTQLQSPYTDKDSTSNLLLSLDGINMLKLQVGYKEVGSSISTQANGAKGSLERNAEYRKELNNGED